PAPACRGPHRDRVSARGAQHALRRPVLPPDDPACRADGLRNLPDARQREGWRGRDRGGAVPGFAGLWRGTLQHYARFTSDVYKKPEGPLYHTYPSLKGAADGEALWHGLLNGELSTIATDVLFCPQEVKLAGHTIEDTVGGNAATEERVGITYTEGV